jgi:preprotein translocase subunit SecA
MLQQHMRLLDLCDEILGGVVDEHCPAHSHAEDWDLDALRAGIKERFGFDAHIDEGKLLDREPLEDSLWQQLETVIEAREQEFSLPVVLHFARYFYLEEIDARWIDHLKSMEALREGINLRGYGQKDPKQEYKKEGYVIFGEMMGAIGRNVAEKLFHMQVRRDEPAPPPRPKAPRRTIESGGGSGQTAPEGQDAGGGEGGEGKAPMRRTEPKVGRNDPCPCGSGKKYKKCHGVQAA